MAMLRSQYPKREVRGLVFFLESRFDPDSDPWREFVQVIYLDEALEQLSREQPDHPLVAVFAPLFASSEEVLETEAAECYTRLDSPELDRASVAGLQEVFVSWLMQRLPFKGAKEIEEMLLGKLPDIRNTRSGQDLIAIGIEQGIEQGIKKGLEEGIDQGKLVGQVQLLESLCNSIPTMETQLRSMSIEQLKSRLNELRNSFDSRQS
jgi:flagellar biosynthesis/type III secretory pathway protein FliH